MHNELKRKLAAILVADVVGYSRLMADDEEATLRRLEVFRAIWQECLTKTSGRIFNTAGDAVLAEFQSAVEAVRCSLEFQARARQENDNLVPGRQMHFRVGITIGDVVERRGDLLGDGVNIAARLQTLAGPGGICVSSWVREAVANKVNVKFTDLGDQQVKNIPTPIRAYLVAAPAGVATAGVQGPAVARSGDWLASAVSSWRGMAAILGLVGAGVFGAFLLASGLRDADSGMSTAGAPSKGDPREIRQTATPPKSPGAAQPAPAKDPPPAKVAEAAPITPITTPSAAPEAAPPTTKQPAEPSAPPAAAPGTKTTSRTDPAVRLGPLGEAAERSLKPGDRFKECETCPEMVVIPAGEFVMGSADTQPGHEPDEAPAHRVTIATRLAVARTAITRSEYEHFVAASGYRPGAGCRVFENGKWVDKPELSFRDPGFPQTQDHPAVCINWNDAKAYTDWMTARMNALYRLPSEAEREYATRAGTSTLFSWGNDIAPSRAAYDWTVSFASSPRGDTRRGTHPVTSFPANQWGLFQMHGNVSEWVEDCWNTSYRGAPTDGSAWISGDCRLRVLRGGSWGYAPKDLRAAYREGATFTFRNFNFGFRVVRVLRDRR